MILSDTIKPTGALGNLIIINFYHQRGEIGHLISSYGSAIHITVKSFISCGPEISISLLSINTNIKSGTPGGNIPHFEKP